MALADSIGSYSTDEGKTWQPLADLAPSQKAGFAAPLWWTTTVRVGEMLVRFSNGTNENDDNNGKGYLIPKSGTYVFKDGVFSELGMLRIDNGGQHQCL
jgi:hypothetical protein